MTQISTKTRLNKYLSECGVASRRKSEEFIKQERITINGRVVSDFSYEVTEDDLVKFDGEVVRPEKKVYFILNKPKGFITTTADEKKRKTVIDLINTDKTIFPVGRLDYDTTGVLLLTNDGDFANVITHPTNKITREYIAELDRALTKEDRLKYQKGINVDRRKSKFSKIFFPRKNNFKIVGVEVFEGRNHFVKRMFDSLGYSVINLHRTKFGHFTVDKIPVGKNRKIAYSEIQKYL